MPNIIDECKNYIEKIFKDSGVSHDLNHTLRVYKNALLIVKNYNCDKEAVLLASLLHDVDDYKLFKTLNNYNARLFLNKYFDEKRTDFIIEIINSVSFTKNHGKKLSIIEQKITQDADRLDAIGSIGIARAFSYGAEKNRPFEKTIEHFYEKLLLIKDELNTLEAKKIAVKRHKIMLDFIEEYKNENV